MTPGARKLAFMAFLGCLLLLLSLVGLHFQLQNQLAWFIANLFLQGMVYLVAVRLVLRGTSTPSGTGIVLLFALLLRISILFAPPYLSDDIYRYIWDGRVQAAGINPYRNIPESPELESLQDDKIFPNINRSDFAPTIYPPLAQAIFLGATRVSESVIWMKAVMVSFEVLTVWLLLKLLASFGVPGERVLIYAWSPLTVWESAGSGHLDAAAIAFLVFALWARRRDSPVLTGITLGCATLIKFYPAAVFPALYRKWDWKMPLTFAATVIAGYLPYAKVGWRVFGYLRGYVEEEGIHSGDRFYLWTLLRKIWPSDWFNGTGYVAVLLLLLLAISLWFIFRKQHTETDFLRHAAVLAVLCVILFSPHYPWYFAWVLPLMVLVPYVPVLYVTAAAFVLYELRLHDETPELLFRSNSVLYLPFVVLVVVYWWWKRRHSQLLASGDIRQKNVRQRSVSSSSGS